MLFYDSVRLYYNSTCWEIIRAFQKKIVVKMFASGKVFLVVCVVATNLVTQKEECQEIKRERRQGKTLTVECCLSKAVLKVDGRVTAEQSLAAAGCATA